MPKDEPIIFTEKDREDGERIKRGTHKLIEILSEELKTSEMSMLYEVWSCTNANLRVVDRNNPKLEIQKLMNRSNLDLSKILDEKDGIKDA